MTIWLIMVAAFFLGFFLVSKLLDAGKSEKKEPVKNSSEPEAVPTANTGTKNQNYILFGELVLLISIAFKGQLPGWCKVLLEDFGQRKLGCSDDDMEGAFLHPVKDILNTIDGKELVVSIRTECNLNPGLNLKIKDFLQSIIETARSSGSSAEAKILSEWLIEMNKTESDVSLQTT